MSDSVRDTVRGRKIKTKGLPAVPAQRKDHREYENRVSAVTP
ncbi:hypothetical protein ACFCXT_27955 [Streptomyces vinaceus]